MVDSHRADSGVDVACSSCVVGDENILLEEDWILDGIAISDQADKLIDAFL